MGDYGRNKVFATDETAPNNTKQTRKTITALHSKNLSSAVSIAIFLALSYVKQKKLRTSAARKGA